MTELRVQTDEGTIYSIHLEMMFGDEIDWTGATLIGDERPSFPACSYCGKRYGVGRTSCDACGGPRIGRT